MDSSAFTDLDFNPGSKEFLHLPTHRCFAQQRGTDTPVLGAAAVHTQQNTFLTALKRPYISRAVPLLCEFLTIFDFIRVISPLHCALPQPDGSLSGWLPFTCRPVQILLVLHADDNVLGIQVLIGWSFCSPCFPMVSPCKASCCP